LQEFKGAILEGVSYRHCLYDRTSPLIAANYISSDDGTGLVHNAPDFGEDDYLACKKYNIHPFNPLDIYCKFTKEINDDLLVGIFYDDANKLITDRLSKANHLLKLSFVNHSAAHDWRTKKPVIYRATKQ
jgi:isoleucyl-tRNA synthetase